MAICDVLIIGSGAAGLSLAIKLNRQFPDRKIYIVTKDDALESNTRYAQGGMSAVCDLKCDSFEKHIEDTLLAGSGLCNKEVVEKVVRYGQKALTDLAENGVELDRDANGDFLLAKEGGHSHARIVHHKDLTGFQIAISLLIKVKTLPGIMLLPNHTAIDLITNRNLAGASGEQEDCYGAFILDQKNGTIKKFLSRITVLATGGIGSIYRITTNPKIATGDGIAIAHRAGAAIRNMEFIQFHPTAFYSSDADAPHFLISEAIRGYGAFLRNNRGERFLFKHDPQGELACRDVVARAIAHQIKTSGHPCVFIDCTHLPPAQLAKDFPGIYSFCKHKGIDITKDLIPVIPAAHYLCGGIDVDCSARTSVRNLYALGECSHTGLHGANRLASNSLLEAIAFSEFCFEDITRSIASISINSAALQAEYQRPVENNGSEGLAVLRQKVQNLMMKHVGITRTTRGLKYALGYLELVEKRLHACYSAAISPELLELRNMLITAKLITIHSLNRKINRGVFYNADLQYVFNNDRADEFFAIL